MSKAIVSSATPVITTEVVSMIGTMLDLSAEHKSLVKAITDGGAEGLSHSVTAAMAALGDTEAADRAVTAAKGLLTDAKRAKDAHTNYRVSIVAAVRKVAPKMTKTAIAELMYGKTGTSAAKTQIGRDFDVLEGLAAVGRFNLSAKAKGQTGVAMTRAEAAKVLRDKSAPERKAILASLEATGQAPAADEVPVVAKVKASTVVRNLSVTVDSLKGLDLSTLDTATLAKIRATLADVDKRVAALSVAPAQATKTA